MRQHRFLSWLLAVALLAALAGTASAAPARVPGAIEDRGPAIALVQVLVPSPEELGQFEQTGLPAYTRLEGSSGSYLLAGAAPRGVAALAAAGLETHILDPDMTGASYYLASLTPGRPEPDWTGFGRLLLADGQQVLLRMSAENVDRVLSAGVELRAVTLAPKPLRPTVSPGAIPAVVTPDPLIQQMIDQVTTGDIYQYDRQFAGESHVWVDGAWYTIPSRYTYSGTPIQKTTHYVGEQLAGQGLAVSYHNWNTTTNPNVIGQYTGSINPDDIYIIGGHIDDVNGTPGADDNASGPVAALLAARIMSQYQWGCTLRFAAWTGEEQGLLGSAAYAQRAHNAGENILGYLNLDMIAWNTIGSPPGMYLTYNPSMASTLQLAQLFRDVVSAYNIDLDPVLGTLYGNSSDQHSFWDYGYPSVLAIEGNDDFNPYYHGPNDTSLNTDPTYFTNMVKASVATFAHMAGCLIPDGIGSLDGHVTAAGGGAPIEGAQVTAGDESGGSFPVATDSSGYYTQTLPNGTYTVTAKAYGYLPGTVDGVVVVTNELTTQDFALQSAPYYTVSGHVTEVGTGAPLLAEIEFAGSPVAVSTDPADGSYQASLAEGSYEMRVKSFRHRAEQRSITVDRDQAQDFALEPTPCALLVDDDRNSPNVQSYWTSALTAAGADYDVWDVEGAGTTPSTEVLADYGTVLWTTGAPSSTTFTDADEAAVSAYLDQGGSFLLASHEYLWEAGQTPFGINYLGIGTYQGDVGHSDVIGNAGDPIGLGWGPYNLVMPPGWSYNWSDNVNGVQGSPFKWLGTGQNNSTRYEGSSFKTVFLAWPFEGLSSLNVRAGVLRHVLAWFGACSLPERTTLYLPIMRR